MNKESVYYKQVQLLVRVLPLLDSEKCFALKGGTAINLFYRELPRLSVDIDLLYLHQKLIRFIRIEVYISVINK